MKRAATRPRQTAKPHKMKPVWIDFSIHSATWLKRPSSKTAIKRAIAAAAEAVSTRPCELAIVLTDDSAIRALNRDWRGKNAPTNVLSFPAAVPAGTIPRSRSGNSGIMPPYIGDIVIAYRTVAREATAEGKRFNHHLAHLAVHGFLHLLGYDHVRESDARRMEGLERRILGRLSIPDPYAPRDPKSR